ncbi:MAG: dienelactone hydrolase family protein [Bacteriovoracaceae bacterium]
MKSMLLFMFVLISMLLAEDRKSCCIPTAIESFAAFEKDIAFVALHIAPELFEFQEVTGSVKSIKTVDGIDATIFIVPSVQHSDNYLFVFHEWWGMNDYIKREAEKLQRDLGNITVIVLDLYDGKVAETPDSARIYIRNVNDERSRSIITAAKNYVGSKAKIATLGWCFGGGWSMQAALMLGKQSSGCVIYYGMPEKDVKKLKTLNSDVLGIFATQDNFINPQIVAEFEKNMKTAKKRLTVKNFNAVHAFANPSNPQHNREMSAQANEATILFLKKAFKHQ